MRATYLSALTIALFAILYRNFWDSPKRTELIPEIETIRTNETKTSRIVRFPAAERLVAIGDLHGDYNAFHSLLRRLGLIGLFDEWTGQRTVLVQVGDQQDRGDGERAIYRLLYRLQDEAASQGGAVFVILGNHDLLNSQLDFRYVSLGGFMDFLKPPVPQPSERVPDWARRIIDTLPNGAKPRAWAVAPGGELSVKMAERQHVAVIVGDTLFVHGGISLQHLNGGVGLEELSRINEDTRRFLHGYTNTMPIVLQGPDSIVWMRSYSNGELAPDGQECKLLYATLKELGVSRMVVGHTVQMGGINSRCGSKIWRVDVGLSAAYGGKPEALQIYHDSVSYVLTSNNIYRGVERSF